MSPPIRDGSGNDIGAIRLGDGSEISEVRTGAGDVLFSAIPDTSMFQSAIYQWTAEAIEVDDGTSPVGWPESLAGLSDATPVGSPIYRASQDGFSAVEYDGTDDGHEWTPDSQLPTGDEARSFVVLVYFPSVTGTDAAFGWGVGSTGSEFFLRAVNDGGPPKAQLFGKDFFGNTTLNAGEWQTAGLSYDGSGSATLYVNGSPDASSSVNSLSTSDANHSLGYEESGSSGYLNGYIAEVVVSDSGESDQAFADYHSNRLG